VVSANTLTPEAVYEVFLSVLQVHGYAAVATGSVIKIVPEVNAKQGPLPLAGKKDTYPDDELITKIIRLDHVPASQLVPILRPLVPQQGHLAAYNPTNTLIITDHAGNIQRLMKIIAGVDRAESDELEVIYEATGRIVPAGGLPLHIGVLVQNVETLRNIALAVNDIPVTRRFITMVTVKYLRYQPSRWHSKNSAKNYKISRSIRYSTI